MKGARHSLKREGVKSKETSFQTRLQHSSHALPRPDGGAARKKADWDEISAGNFGALLQFMEPGRMDFPFGVTAVWKASREN